MHIKRLLTKWLPTHQTIQSQHSLRGLHRLLQNPDIWHLHRHPVAKGAAIGIFIGFMPIPLQMLCAALLAIFFRANLPIAVIMTWLTNPLTFVPINFFIYAVGSWITGEKAEPLHLPHWKWHFENVHEICQHISAVFTSLGKPYLVGLFVVSIGASLLGYILIKIVWRISVIWRWKHSRRKM